MDVAWQTPSEGESNRCPVCGGAVVAEPSRPAGDAACPTCGQRLWFGPGVPPRDATPPEKAERRPECRRVGTEFTHVVPFDADAWWAGSLRARGAMAVDLERNGSLLGLSSTDVAWLLGEPDGKQGCLWIYAVDRGVRLTGRGLAHRLVVRFDGSRRVGGAAVVQRTVNPTNE